VLPDRSVSGDEADTAAGQELLAALPPDVRASVRAADGIGSAAQAKAVIARCEWFVGARMHAAIAALSSGVPCAAVAYSGKFRGVFATLGAPDSVLDARRLDTGELVDAALAAFDDRERVRAGLPTATGAARRQAREQMAHVLTAAAPR
jgi:polysaccharide pyruvyl transferase WcaK-like protein